MVRKNPKRAVRRQRGAALLVAIAAVGLIAAISIELIEGVQDEIRLVEAYRDGFRAKWAVQAPVAVVIAILQEDENKYAGVTEAWATLKDTMDVGGVPVVFRVRDESSKINPNALALGDAKIRDRTANLLKKVFQAKNLNDTLVDYLWDWMDSDSNSRTSGSEEAFYETLPFPYPMKNRSLDTLSEIHLVRGFTDKTLKELGFQDRAGSPDLNLSGWLTVFSENKINLNTADPLILQNLTPGIPDVFISELVAQREAGPFGDVSDSKTLTGMNDTLFNQMSPLVTVDSKYFSVYSEAVVGRIRKRLTVVLKKDNEHVSIVYWRLS
ncbi:MAG: type II secretion system minor pseudopilin GspK [bacterium]